MRVRRPALALALATPCLLAGPAAKAAPVSAAPSPVKVRMVEAWPGVTFKEPVDVVHPGDGSDWLFVVEQPGRIQRIAKWRGVGPVPSPTRFLDLSATGEVVTRAQGGMLGLAFHPQFASNGRLFVTFLAAHRDPADPRNAFKLVLAEFRGTADGCDPGSRRVLLEIPKEAPIHQAGGIAFGPDGMLYLGVGDGGAKNDRTGFAQNPAVLLGKILRLDVDRRGERAAYGIPRDNPWAQAGPSVRPEIWAYGFRNPWRFSFAPDGVLWLGEPGTGGVGCREWITEVRRGGNHGWPFYEGSRRTPEVDLPPAPTAGGYVPRTFEYERADADSNTCAVGGRVYRGDRVKELRGRYVFADYMRGEVYSLALQRDASNRWVGTDWRKLGDVPECVSIGEDAQGEIYFCSNDQGFVMTMAP